MIRIVSVWIILLSVQAANAWDVLASGTLYTEGLTNYQELNGSEWYSVTSSPSKVKKIKLKTVPDEDNQINSAINIKAEDDVIFFVRGTKVIEGPVKDSQSSIVVTKKETALVGGCFIYYTSEEVKSERDPSGKKMKEAREYFVKCAGKSHSIKKYFLETEDIPPTISWAGDINGDGIPEFQISFDPWEKSVPDIIYFSEETKDGYKFKAEQLQYQGC